MPILDAKQTSYDRLNFRRIADEFYYGRLEPLHIVYLERGIWQ